jgi:hypothetical protein
MTLNPLKALYERRAKRQEKQDQEHVETARKLIEFYKPYAAAEKYLNTLMLFAGSKAEYEERTGERFEYHALPGPMQQVFFWYNHDCGQMGGLQPAIADNLKSAGVVAFVGMQYVGGSGPELLSDLGNYMALPIKKLKTLDEKL